MSQKTTVAIQGKYEGETETRKLTQEMPKGLKYAKCIDQ